MFSGLNSLDLPVHSVDLEWDHRVIRTHFQINLPLEFRLVGPPAADLQLYGWPLLRVQHIAWNTFASLSQESISSADISPVGKSHRRGYLDCRVLPTHHRQVVPHHALFELDVATPHSLGQGSAVKEFCYSLLHGLCGLDVLVFTVVRFWNQR